MGAEPDSLIRSDARRPRSRVFLKDTLHEGARLLKMMGDTLDLYFDSISQIKVDRWPVGRTALLGDAAYCSSPLSGIGTEMAVVGAYVLAGELKEADGDHVIAFARYETLTREYVTHCQKMMIDVPRKVAHSIALKNYSG